MSSGLLATVPSTPTGNGNGETGFPVEASRDAAAPSGKQLNSYISPQFFITSSLVCSSELRSSYSFYRLSDAGSLPGRLAKRCHDVHAGRPTNQHWNTPAG